MHKVRHRARTLKEKKKEKKDSLTRDRRPSQGPLTFGCELESLLITSKQYQSDLRVPLFIKHCIEHLIRTGVDAEGIFRISGAITEINQTKEEYDKSLNVQNLLSLKSVDPHVVTALLKLFLRELPVPLLTFELGSKFCAVIEEENNETKRNKMREIINSLPVTHKWTLYSLLLLLNIISCNSAMNMMDSDNLGRVIGPNLFWEKGELSLDLMVKVIAIAKFLIEEVHALFDFPVSSFGFSTQSQSAILLTKLVGHRKSIQCLCQTSDGRFIWSADSLGVIRIYNAQDRELVKEVKSGASNIFCMKEVGGNVWLGSAASIQIRNAVTGDLVKEMANQPAYALEVLGNTIWTSGEKTIQIWNTESLDPAGEIDVGFLSFFLAKVNGFVWAGGIDGHIRVIDVSNNQIVKDFVAHSRKVNCILYVAPHVWTASDDGAIKIWNCKNFQMMQELQGHNGYVYGLTEFGSRIWSCSWDKKILIWNANTFKLMEELPVYHNDAVREVLGWWDTQHGRWQAWSCSYDRSINVWNLPACDKSLSGSLEELSFTESTSSLDLTSSTRFEDEGSLSSSSLSSIRNAPLSSRPIGVHLDAIADRSSGPDTPYTSIVPYANVVEALNEMLGEGLPVYIWLGSPREGGLASLLPRAEWVAQHLGKEWTERVLVSPDPSFIDMLIFIDYGLAGRAREETDIMSVPRVIFSEPVSDWRDWRQSLPINY
jgi:WD40 repeat protein